MSTAACNDKLSLHQSFIIKTYFCPGAASKQTHLRYADAAVSTHYTGREREGRRGSMTVRIEVGHNVFRDPLACANIQPSDKIFVEKTTTNFKDNLFVL